MVKKWEIYPFIVENNQHLFFCDTFPLKDWAKVLRNSEVQYSAQYSDFPQYDTAWSQALQSIILRGVNLKKLKYLGKIENILTPDLVAKADSNCEKTGRKYRLTVPLKRIRKSHLTPCTMIVCRTWLRAVWWCAELRKNSNILAKTKPKTKLCLPIGHWPRLVWMMKQTGGRKSRWTVPLRRWKRGWGW